MSETVEKALEFWGIQGAEHRLAAARENRVYRVQHDGKLYAMRLHRKGYRTDAELASELQWMAELEMHGLLVPRPIASKTGEFLHIIGGIQVDMLSWIGGRHLDSAIENLPEAGRASLFHAIGRETARLHLISDAWTPPSNFTRWAWDRPGLLGEVPVWGRFWENPALKAPERKLLEDARSWASAELEARESSLDYGLIHADILVENVLVDGDKVRLIDFDDGGYGFRLFELATLLLKLQEEPDYDSLKSALLSGYREVRPISDEMLDFFFLLRALTYVGWISDRMEIEGAEERRRSSIRLALQLASEIPSRGDG